jgi:hypothetical protein
MYQDTLDKTHTPAICLKHKEPYIILKLSPASRSRFQLLPSTLPASPEHCQSQSAQTGTPQTVGAVLVLVWLPKSINRMTIPNLSLIIGTFFIVVAESAA